MKTLQITPKPPKKNKSHHENSPNHPQSFPRKPQSIQLWDSVVELCAERRFLEAYKQARASALAAAGSRKSFRVSPRLGRGLGGGPLGGKKCVFLFF